MHHSKPYIPKQMPTSHTVIIKNLGLTDYQETWLKMQEFNSKRNQTTLDEIWCLQHMPVYTLGLAGKQDHLLTETEIPIIRSDRGGQITYHGPGQLIIYVMINLKRKNLLVRNLITTLEQAVIDYLATINCKAKNNLNARGIYVQNKKIASIGLRVSKGCSFHGIAINIDMDLSPFQNINPCGIKNLSMTQIKDIDPNCKLNQIQTQLILYLTKQLNYTKVLTNH